MLDKSGYCSVARSTIMNAVSDFAVSQRASHLYAYRVNRDAFALEFLDSLQKVCRIFIIDP